MTWWWMGAMAAAGPAGAGTLIPPAERAAYPTVQADNLIGEEVRLPDDLVGHATLVLVVWTQEQQLVANTWLERWPELSARAPDLRVMENPVVHPLWRLAKGTVDGWMRSGIVDEAARDRTVTLYVGAGWLAGELGIQERSTISVLLVDARGRIARRWLGPASDARLDDVVASVGGL